MPLLTCPLCYGNSIFRRGNIGLKRHVLVVDDELINREILGNLLKADYEVHFAEDGQQALDILRAREAMDYSELLGKILGEKERLEAMCRE